MAGLPFAFMNFIKSTNRDEKTLTKFVNTNDSLSEESISGAEARIFYENLVLSGHSDGKRKIKCEQKIPKQRSEGAKRHICKKISEHEFNAFLKAASDGDSTFVSDHLKNDSSHIDAVDIFGWTALMCAAYSGHIHTVDLLMSYGANSAKIDKRGRNALNLALQKRHWAIADRIFSKKVNSQVPNTANEYPFIYYCNDCRLQYTDESHQTSTVHLISTKKPLSHPGYGIPETNRGYRILQKCGWDEYKGLGSNSEGRRYPIKTVLKRDRSGLGHGNVLLQRAKVTHFSAGDTDAVRDYSQGKSGPEKEREDGGKRRKCWEANFRRQFWAE